MKHFQFTLFNMCMYLGPFLATSLVMTQAVNSEVLSSTVSIRCVRNNLISTGCQLPSESDFYTDVNYIEYKGGDSGDIIISESSTSNAQTNRPGGTRIQRCSIGSVESQFSTTCFNPFRGSVRVQVIPHNFRNSTSIYVVPR